MSSEQADRGRRVDIAHEALISGWPRLQQWLAERRETEQARRRLEDKTEEWLRLGKGKGGLLDAAELAEAEHWMASPDAADLGSSAALPALIQASRIEQARELRQLRMLLLGVGALAVVAVALLVWVAKSNIDLNYEVGQKLAALKQAEDESERANQALSRLISAHASDVAETSPNLAALLALEAIDRSPTVEARQSLVDLLSSSRQRFAMRPPDKVDKTNAVVRFNGDGSLLASGGHDGRVEVWSQSDQDWQRLPGFQAEDGQIADLAFAPEGSVLAIAALDGSIGVWNARTGDPKEPSPANETLRKFGSRTIRFSPDGRLLAWGAKDDTIGVWDLSRGAVDVLCAADLTATAFDPRQGEPCREFDSAPHWINGLTFCRNPLILASGGDDGRIVIWERHEEGWRGRLLVQGDPSVTSLDCSASQPIMAAGLADGTIRLFHFDGDTWQPVDSPLRLAGNEGLTKIEFTQDGEFLGAAGDHGTIAIWEQRDGQWTALPNWPGKLPGKGDGVTGLSFSPTQALVATGHSDGNVIVWDYSSTPSLAKSPADNLVDSPKSVRFNANATLMATGQEDGHVNVLAETAGGWAQESLASPPGSSPVRSLAFGVNQPLLASGDDHGDITLWRKTNDTWQPEPHGKGSGAPIRSLAFSPTYVASGDGDGQVVLHNLENGEEFSLGNATGSSVLALAFSPVEQRLAAGYDDGNIRVWDPSDWRNPKDTPLGGPGRAHQSGVTVLAFGVDGTLYSGSADGTIGVWNLTGTGSSYSVKVGSEVTSLALTPNGEVLAVSTKRKLIALIDKGNREAFVSLPVSGYNSYIAATAFTADGRTLIGTDSSGTVIAWDVDIESWKDRACALAGRTLEENEERSYLGGESARYDCASRTIE